MPGPLLFERYPPLLSRLDHLPLGEGPTPVREMRELAPEGTAPVWLKDDGVYGSIYGGNKVRKLEWLLADVRRRGARCILTAGGLATNWGLAAALYARRLGIATEIALVDQPMDDHVRAQLARLEAVATLHRTRSTPRTVVAAPWLVVRRTLKDRRFPYLVGPGGSSARGALGYVECALEIAHQVEEGILPAPTHAVVALGSGGTVAGLALGLRMAGLRTRVVGVVVAHQLRLDVPVVIRLARRGEALLRRRGADLGDVSVGADDVVITREWLGAGYGHGTEESSRALALAASREGLELDPVYTAKAMAALVDLNARGLFGEGPVLFVNTYDSLSRSTTSAAPPREVS